MARRKLLTLQEVETAHAGGRAVISLARATLVTPLARDTARRLGVQLVVEAPAGRRVAIFGNWKANGTAREARTRGAAVAQAALSASDGVELCVFPPACHLPLVADALAGSPAALGAQDVAAEPPGAATGCVPAAMLWDLGCRYVLIGHSERRRLFGERGALCRRKIARALEADLQPVLCVGETLPERDAARTHSILRRQLLDALERLRPRGAARLTVAYEPVWAIGTGLSPAQDDIALALGGLRDALARRFDDQVAARVRLLYGGSVKPQNAAGVLRVPDCDGVLVGGASLDPAAFAAIARCARRGGSEIAQPSETT